MSAGNGQTNDSGKNSKQNGDRQGEVETGHPFQQIDVALDLADACFVVRHCSGCGASLGFAGSSFDLARRKSLR